MLECCADNANAWACCADHLSGSAVLRLQRTALMHEATVLTTRRSSDSAALRLHMQSQHMHNANAWRVLCSRPASACVDI